MSTNPQVFDDHVPQRVQKALLKCIFENYKEEGA
jgi:hypothetical protein